MVKVIDPSMLNTGNSNANVSSGIEVPTHLSAQSRFNKDNIAQKSELLSSRNVPRDVNPGKAITSKLPGEAPDGWTRQDMLSNGVIYAEPVLLRPMTAAVLKRLASARSSGSFTGMLDALQYCINIDIRDLTVPDLYFMIYWQRLNSYPRSPLTITWTSKYGNSNITRIRELSTFDLIELPMTKTELEKWQTEWNITIPTVRCMEVLQNEDLNEGDRWEIRYAQYMYVPNSTPETYLEDCLKAFNDADLDIVAKIDEFSELIEHGVIEQVKAKDDKFELATAIPAIKQELENLGRMWKAMQDSNDDVNASTNILAMVQHIDNRQQLLTKLETALQNGEDVEADEEVVSIGSADIDMLFP